ncbi:MAG TPA: 3-hydroxyacyl-ACP dehydratase FabZ family protein [Pirellulales bacterium]|jgi:3-hydroxyacyl-[acyl-carrier-protein] dehydratase|nr:3-hydroxyacyl-ACP dehydratase FabZ family protein [Pirellulales bacterium]
MRFTLLDRIVQLEPGKRVTAVKALALAEEYLADHFPSFPVMPGVLMLEAMTQAGAWLVRAGEDFAHSIVVLKEARNVKYSNFVAPGQTLTVTAEIVGQDPRQTRFKAQGTVDGEVQLSGRLVLERYNLADEGMGAADDDARVKRELRKLFALLYRPTPIHATDLAPGGDLRSAHP